MSSEAQFPRFPVAVGIATVPATVLILAGRPLIGAATLLGVLAIWSAHARMVLKTHVVPPRAPAPTADSDDGDDPAEVLRALRQRVPERRDDSDLFHPDDEDDWVHLRPTEW